jgi:hypothetical protein
MVGMSIRTYCHYDESVTYYKHERKPNISIRTKTKGGEES